MAAGSSCCIPPPSASIFTSLSPRVSYPCLRSSDRPLLSFIRRAVMGLREIILRSLMPSERPYCQTRSPSQVPGVRTWSYISGDHYSIPHKVNGTDRAQWVGCKGHTALGFHCRLQPVQETWQGQGWTQSQKQVVLLERRP